MGLYGTYAEYILLTGPLWGSKIPTELTWDLEGLGLFGVAGLTAFKVLATSEIRFAREWKQGHVNSGPGGKVSINGGSHGVGTYTYGTDGEARNGL